jgi:hypothetical protein
MKTPRLLDDRTFLVVKRLIVVGVVASLVHFADNAFEIGSYPEPTWITPGIALFAWIPDGIIAIAAGLRKNGDRIFVFISTIFGMLMLTGLAHYLYGSPFQMAFFSNLTIIFEAATGLAILAVLWWALARSAPQTLKITDVAK